MDLRFREFPHHSGDYRQIAAAACERALEQRKLLALAPWHPRLCQDAHPYREPKGLQIMATLQ